jgi:hypothetical protein
VTDNRATRVSPLPYICAVADALRKRRIRVGPVELRTHGVREASMQVTDIGLDSPLWESAEWIRLRWNDTHGWRWHALLRGEPRSERSIYFTMTAVPHPNDVSDWLFVCLCHPELTPLRTTPQPTARAPDIDHLLRTYHR